MIGDYVDRRPCALSEDAGIKCKIFFVYFMHCYIFLLCRYGVAYEGKIKTYLYLGKFIIIILMEYSAEKL